MRSSGELGGVLSFLSMTPSASIGRTLTAAQQSALAGLRPRNPDDPKGPFLYSQPIEMPPIGETDSFFGRPSSSHRSLAPRAKSTKGSQS